MIVINIYIAIFSCLIIIFLYFLYFAGLQKEAGNGKEGLFESTGRISRWQLAAGKLKYDNAYFPSSIE
jgi:low temperature requirement protein LtrA